MELGKSPFDDVSGQALLKWLVTQGVSIPNRSSIIPSGVQLFYKETEDVDLTLDGGQPVISNFIAESVQVIVAMSLHVTELAVDDEGHNGVSFRITAPVSVILDSEDSPQSVGKSYGLTVWNILAGAAAPIDVKFNPVWGTNFVGGKAKGGIWYYPLNF